DGIRGFHVTGVQTCALPISAVARRSPAMRTPSAVRSARTVVPSGDSAGLTPVVAGRVSGCAVRTRSKNDVEVEDRKDGPKPVTRSEERRVGKECRDQGSAGR